MKYGLLIEQYLLGPELLRRAIGGMSDEHLNARPIPGKWSTQEVIFHVSDFDLLYANHMKRVIAEDRPALVDVDAELFISRLAYDKRDVDREIGMVMAIRRHMAAILHGVDADDFARVGEHTGDGKVTLAELLRRISDHIPHHVRAIEEKRRALNVSSLVMPLHLAGVGMR